MQVLIQIGLVSLGSALGGVTRWLVIILAARLLGTAWPYGVFFINLSGSCFLGWFATYMTEKFQLGDITWIRAQDLTLLVAVGFTGAYTTFSTFEYDTHRLMQDGDGLAAMTYVFASVFLGLLAVRLGVMLARW